MGLFRQSVVAGALAGVAAGSAAGATHVRQTVDPWSAAVSTRQAFEAEPQGTHTKPEYAHVMDGFRAIYHGNPRDAHAARAAEQVAELLAEQGREFNDRKSLHDAAGQYEFVARSYPGGTRAAEALAHAAELLGPNGADDRAEAKSVREELAQEYPQDAVRLSARGSSVPERAGTQAGAQAVTQAGNPIATRQPAGEQPATMAQPRPANRAQAINPAKDFEETSDSHVAAPVPVHLTAVAAAPATHLEPAAANDVVTPALTGERAQVTGIRHWSTSSYTRVAIDLGGEVQFQAARVENPDRIFFDLHHAHLASSLAGKSFAVTDDGFLTRIRAAQYSDDVTRVVLDVHEVTEYSAFLLPNPYRLIIDIHGKQERQETGSSKQEVARSEDTVSIGDGERSAAPVRERVEQPPAPLVRQPALGAGPSASSATADRSSNGSSLPPMPVTDGGASFGLPAKTSTAVASASVPEPRVVIPSRSTPAKPVPNSVTLKSEATGSEVAAVSSQPGKVEATTKPTSSPISAKSKGPVASESSADPTEIATIARGDHYRKPSHGSNAAGSPSSSASVSAPKPVKLGTGQLGTAQTASPTEAAPPTADGETSLMRALGLKIGRIVIDAGHGGHDSGTLGASGIEEKDVVLDVALRLGKLLHDRLGAEIVYTRADDTFIPLETRTAIANKAQADLFISVHANSSPDASARGVEVYYLNFTSDPDAMRVAGRENAVSTQSVHELSDLVKKIALKDKIEESRELAADVDQSLYAGLAKGNDGLRDRGVKKAPFVVLIGANMPSILAEISFVTNPTDAEKLERPEYRERVAESIYKGVAQYAGSINGKAKVAASERAQK